MKISLRKWSSISVWLLALCLAGCATTNHGTKKAPEKNQRAAKFNVDLGVAYMNEGEFELSLDKLNRALLFDPFSAPAHSAIAVLYNNLGETKLAEQHFRKSLELDPTDSATRNNFGAYLCDQKRYEEAEQEILAAVDNPVYASPAMAYANMGVCAKRIPDLVKAEKYFRLALDKNPRHVQSLTQMVQIAIEQSNYEQAQAFLQRLQAAGSLTAEILWLGHEKIANSYGEALLEKFPNSHQAKQLWASGQYNASAQQAD